GDKVGIAAPSGTVRPKPFEQGVRVLESWGLKPVYRKDILSQHRYFAGNERRRLGELQALIDREDIKAILFARGGFGLHHLLPELKLRTLERYPKRVIAYSDLTMLLERIRVETGLVTYYGPTIGQLASPKEGRVRRDYQKILFKSNLGPSWTLGQGKILKAGRTEGTLVGGCLSLVSTSIGTPFELDTRNSILLLEDINESVYRFERLLLHLKQSRKLKGVRGLVISAIEDKASKSPPRVWKRMLKELLGDFPGPIIFGFACGHLENPYTLPLGCRVRLDTHRGELLLVS
ncbi:MAG: LD-carboxypeptidase, partial [Arenicellales bacterium]|nr:LD-carboxypeptidase [Arenicellales bacterium]